MREEYNRQVTNRQVTALEIKIRREIEEFITKNK